jgi:hypothetical protein
MGAAADCELIGPGLLGQPVNTITTLAFVVAGAYLSSRPRLLWVGIALGATGIGSFLFHGPMPAGSEWAHDVTLAWLILVIAGIGRPWERWTRLPGLIVIAAIFALVPVSADPVAVALTVTAIFLILRRDHSVAMLAPLGFIAAVAIIGRLGATGNPLCDPESLLQPHGLWHIGAAVGVVWWALSIDSADLSLRS